MHSRTVVLFAKYPFFLPLHPAARTTSSPTSSKRRASPSPATTSLRPAGRPFGSTAKAGGRLGSTVRWLSASIPPSILLLSSTPSAPFSSSLPLSFCTTPRLSCPTPRPTCPTLRPTCLLPSHVLLTMPQNGMKKTSPVLTSLPDGRPPRHRARLRAQSHRHRRRRGCLRCQGGTGALRYKGEGGGAGDVG